MKGIARDSTLLMTVGRPNRPLCAGSGGLRGRCRACLRGFPARSPRRRHRRRRRPGLRGRRRGWSRRCPRRDSRYAGRRDRGVHRRHRMRIFRADVDVAFGGADGDAGVMPSITTKGSPSMIMRSAKVPLSPSSALQTMYFAVGACLRHRLPLDAGREAGAAARAVQMS